MHYETIGISDLHIDGRNSEYKKIRKFLHKIKRGKISTNLLLIIGDLMDKNDLKRLKKKHWKIIKLLRRISKKTHLIILLGNHDCEKKQLLDLDFDVREELEFTSGKNRVYVAHGHYHDKFLEEHPIITNIADFIYGLSQFIDPSHRLAKTLKKRSKQFLRAARKIGFGMAQSAKNKGCKIVWHGHNHNGGKTMIDGIEVWDSGCWTDKPGTYLTINNGITELHEFM